MNALVQETGHPAISNAHAHPCHRNAVLEALSPSAFSILEPHLRYCRFKEGAVLWRVGEQCDRIYFPWSGMIAVTLPIEAGVGIEVASVGREGAAGIDFGAGQFTSVTQGTTQIAGTFSYMAASSFASAARKHAEIDRLAVLCCSWLVTQSQQIAACNAIHPANARFCRWLLQAAERVDGDLIPSTHEAIGYALGIRRTTVTLIAQNLQSTGIISYRRGKITILDRDGLRSAACDCCGALGRRNWPSERFASENEAYHLYPHTCGPGELVRSS